MLLEKTSREEEIKELNPGYSHVHPTLNPWDKKADNSPDMLSNRYLEVSSLGHSGNKTSKGLFGVSSRRSSRAQQADKRVAIPPPSSPPHPLLCLLCANSKLLGGRLQAHKKLGQGSGRVTGHSDLGFGHWSPRCAGRGHPFLFPHCPQALPHTWPWALANILIWCIINVTVIQGREASGTN